MYKKKILISSHCFLDAPHSYGPEGDIFEDYYVEGNKCLLKIDVQGYEEQVLMGAMSTLSKVNAVKLECALVSLYEGDKTYEHYFTFFEDNGFELYDMEAGFSNPKTGKLLQFDAFFVRT